PGRFGSAPGRQGRQPRRSTVPAIASWRLCATSVPSESQIVHSSSNHSPASALHRDSQRSHPGAGRPRNKTVSSTVGAHPYRPRLNTVGGPESDATISDHTSGGEPSRSRNQNRTVGSPVGFGKGAVAGSTRISTWSNISIVKSGLPAGTQSSGAGIG